MAKIGLLKEAIQLCGDAGVTAFIWGHRGLGKSSLVKQTCAGNGWGFIDLRCSQMEASDLRGLPARGEDKRTHYLPPADMPIGDLTDKQIADKLGKVPNFLDESPEGLEARRTFDERLNELQPHFQRGILFLDELNRASDDVLQAAFQLVLDRKVGQYSLPPGWFVVCAGNYNEGYVTNGFTDPAFINRFCHLQISGGDTTLEEWVGYMSASHGADCANVIEFASHNMKHLDGEVAGEMGFSIQPSRRSWDAVVRVEKAAKSYSPDARTEVIAGLVGRELALSYSRYSCPVKPRDLLDRGVKPLERQLLGLERGQQTGLMWGLISIVKPKIDENKDYQDTCLDYADFMLRNMKDRDLVTAFLRTLVVGQGDKSSEKARASMISNPTLAAIVAKMQKKSSGKKSFIEALTDRKDLHNLVSKAAWGL